MTRKIFGRNINFAVTDDQYQSLLEIAESQDTTISDLMRGMVAEETGIEAVTPRQERCGAILDLLATQEDGLTIGDISLSTGLDPMATGRVLRELREDGLVVVTGISGRSYVYSLPDDGKKDIFVG